VHSWWDSSKELSHLGMILRDSAKFIKGAGQIHKSRGPRILDVDSAYTPKAGYNEYL